MKWPTWGPRRIADLEREVARLRHEVEEKDAVIGVLSASIDILRAVAGEYAAMYADNPRRLAGIRASLEDAMAGRCRGDGEPGREDDEVSVRDVPVAVDQHGGPGL